MRIVACWALLGLFLAGCNYGSPVSGETWTPEETEYWLQVNKDVPRSEDLIGSSLFETEESPENSLVFTQAPPTMAVLQELYRDVVFRCVATTHLDGCLATLPAVRMELAAIVERKGSYPEGYRHLSPQTP